MSTSEAERLYSRAFRNLFQSAAEVQTFRKIAQLGKPAASAALNIENYQLALSLQNDPAFGAFFGSAKAALEFLGGTEGISASATTKQLAQSDRAVDAASLIFLHSAVDASVSDLCRVTLLLAPVEWKRFVDTQKVTIGDLQDHTADELLQEKLTTHMDALERESLLKRVNRLFEVCKPAPGFDPVGNFAYDSARLLSIDELRHRLTHGDRAATTIPDWAELQEYLMKTGLYMASMVNWKFGIRVDPAIVVGLDLSGVAAAKSGQSVKASP